MFASITVSFGFTQLVFTDVIMKSIIVLTWLTSYMSFGLNCSPFPYFKTLQKIATHYLIIPSISLSVAMFPQNFPVQADQFKPVATTSLSQTLVLSNGAESKVYFGVGCFWHVQHEFVGAIVKYL